MEKMTFVLGISGWAVHHRGSTCHSTKSKERKKGKEKKEGYYKINLKEFFPSNAHNIGSYFLLSFP